ncbi:pyrimidine/purine nucleoside phosphorylase [Pyramidobacter sp.]|uniref:pyrimidine/purine nucleoside phosphorylase n=1 Tax=Pyramidobacter sp. TaxID=1943581 RepID=UPI0025F9B0BD|nr:pyrimidine/purine nucleoside phosphorylase [Pyramidobacter sp.]MCI7402651.1 pyrimidine/purine nucleoside phosphorylase [Pyramidobacter sp.]MDY3212051.1 pyrimidine/purine nucleoside phosphorylase [Pyramidobacter sp.]
MPELADRFENVTVLVKANIFADGRCQSRTLIFPDGSKKTLGVYMPGEFVFDSHEPERVLVTSGSVEVFFSHDAGWHTVSAGEYYDVPANCTFKVRTQGMAEYICDFLFE